MIRVIAVVFTLGVLGYMAVSTQQVRNANAEGTISAPAPVNKPGRAPTKQEQENANNNSNSNYSGSSNYDTSGASSGGGCCS